MIVESYIIRAKHAVIPAQAGIQRVSKNAFYLLLDSGLRRNDVCLTAPCFSIGFISDSIRNQVCCGRVMSSGLTQASNSCSVT